MGRQGTARGARKSDYSFFIEGDGTGPDIWAAAQPVFDAAVAQAYGGKRYFIWRELLAGEKAQRIHGSDTLLPEKTIQDIAYYGIAIKGPLTTPVGSGFRSLNVTLRQKLDLYACIRPVNHLPGVPAPVVHPERLNVVIFGENTEDVYAGIEWEAGSQDAKEVVEVINKKLKDKETVSKPLSLDSAIGIKAMS